MGLESGYVKILKFFKIFGLVPNQLNEPNLVISRRYASLIIIFLTFYWAVLLLSFWVPHGKDVNKISVISNWIQLLFNAVTLSVALGYPIVASPIVSRIRNLFANFDQKVAANGVEGDSRKISRKIGFIVGPLVTFNSYMLVYDLYVTCFHTAVSHFWYWLLTFLPLFVYSFGVGAALCVLTHLRARFKILNKQLLREIRTDKCGVVIEVLKTGEIRKDGKKLRDTFHLMHDLYELAKLIGDYYGPMFLAVFTAIFVVTTIQTYYIYTFFLSFEVMGSDVIWSIILSANIILLNFSLVFSITWICEAISNESKVAIDRIANLKINGTVSVNEAEDVQRIANCFSCTTSSITFSANGFFNINYSMLCSMIGGITTYLIIYIQFYSLYGQEDELPSGHRSNGMDQELRDSLLNESESD
ncbi:uncharacterized protein LOC134833812 [Culicoides brevitarsis]|uniref:uncharacterized protein LOC134833812 n=1 Tax=Culicoides brevitarsis TaxID=469753 RepID=UPI00307C7826